MDGDGDGNGRSHGHARLRVLALGLQALRPKPDRLASSLSAFEPRPCLPDPAAARPSIPWSTSIDSNPQRIEAARLLRSCGSWSRRVMSVSFSVTLPTRTRWVLLAAVVAPGSAFALIAPRLAGWSSFAQGALGTTRRSPTTRHRQSISSGPNYIYMSITPSPPEGRHLHRLTASPPHRLTASPPHRPPTHTSAPPHLPLDARLLPLLVPMVPGSCCSGSTVSR